MQYVGGTDETKVEFIIQTHDERGWARNHKAMMNPTVMGFLLDLSMWRRENLEPGHKVVNWWKNERTSRRK